MLPGESKGKLIFPCNCKDIIKLVHSQCIQSHMEITKELQCQICFADFVIGNEKKKEIKSWVNMQKREHRF